MQKIFLLFITCFALLGCSAEQTINKEYDLYLLIGQSNMAGRGYLIENDTLNSIEGVYILNQKGEIVEARNPLNQYSTIGKEYAMQQMSPAFSFSKMVRKESGRKILLVVNARGGSSISEWSPSNDSTKFYSEAIRRTKQAMKYGDLKAVLWHQGCSDSSDKLREKYMGRLNELAENLRSDLGNDDLYFLAGELGHWRASSPSFNNMIHTIGENIKNSDYISSQGAEMRSDPSDPHFSRDGQIVLGERYAEKVLKKVYNK